MNDVVAMDPYPYRHNFKTAVKELRLEKKITLAAVADMLGLELPSLHDYLYRPLNRPGREVLQRLSKLTGRSVTEFDDDPGANNIEGLAKGDLREISPAKRAVMNMLFQRLKPEDVTDDMAMAYLKIMEAAIDSGRVRKADWMK